VNKKTIELAKQAGFLFWEDESWGPGSEHIDWATEYDKELEKLVELVVQECAKSVQHIKIWNTDLGEVIVEKFYGK
jgi:hypothetical protein